MREPRAIQNLPRMMNTRRTSHTLCASPGFAPDMLFDCCTCILDLDGRGSAGSRTGVRRDGRNVGVLVGWQVPGLCLLESPSRYPLRGLLQVLTAQCALSVTLVRTVTAPSSHLVRTVLEPCPHAHCSRVPPCGRRNEVCRVQRLGGYFCLCLDRAMPLLGSHDLCHKTEGAIHLFTVALDVY